jgi:hypothetical protein
MHASVSITGILVAMIYSSLGWGVVRLSIITRIFKTTVFTPLF